MQLVISGDDVNIHDEIAASRGRCLHVICWLVIASGVMIGCSHGAASSSGDDATAGSDIAVKKDRMALRAIEHSPPTCKADNECITGSHCDAKTEHCVWQCIADSDCGAAAHCTANGSCATGARLTAQIHAADDTSCIDVSVLTTLNDDQRTCSGDDSCPCGSFCNGLSGLCEVDCIAGDDNLPVSIPGCDNDQVCTALGRCAAATTTPPPPIQALTLQIAPLVISANSIAAPVLVPATVTVTANSLDFLRPTQPATVRYHVVTPAGSPPAPGTLPQIKCAADAPLTDQCDITGWAFHVDSGSLVSDPQTIWVQIPQSATAAQWTLQARSDWALTPVSSEISAEPIAFPTTDPGHYTGTMTWTNRGATAGAAPLQTPVEAFVTADDIALYEPSRILWPAGHAVLVSVRPNFHDTRTAT
jgi:hypothetical protein